jgi:hypothetical protein
VKVQERPFRMLREGDKDPKDPNREAGAGSGTKSYPDESLCRVFDAHVRHNAHVRR